MFAPEADGVSGAFLVGVVQLQPVSFATAEGPDLDADRHVLGLEVVAALREVRVVEPSLFFFRRGSAVGQGAQPRVPSAVANVDEFHDEHGGEDAPSDGVGDGERLNTELGADLADRVDLAAAQDDLAEPGAAERRRAPHRGQESADDA